MDLGPLTRPLEEINANESVHFSLAFTLIMNLARLYRAIHNLRWVK